MFEKLLKLANDLDKAGKFEEADMVDEIMLSFAADEELEGLSEEADVIPAVPAGGQMDELAAMRAEFERLKKENEELRLNKMRKEPSNRIKVSPKGGVSVYGIMRFPVTLYATGWVKLLSMKEEILKFITENDAMLAKKEKP